MLSKLFKIFQIILGLFKINNRIISGPFSGLFIKKDFFGSSFYPKILGTYESEISDIIMTEFKQSEVFFDIGCAGGYYLQLAAQINENLDIFGLDINKAAIESIKKLELSSRFELIHNKFDSSIINLIKNKIKNKKSFIIVDIEGYEWDYINDFINLKKENKNLAIIIEIHNHDPRAFNLSDHNFINTRGLIIDYRFKNGVPFNKLITENEFRDKNTQYLKL